MWTRRRASEWIGLIARRLALVFTKMAANQRALADAYRPKYLKSTRGSIVSVQNKGGRGGNPIFKKAQANGEGEGICGTQPAFGQLYASGAPVGRRFSGFTPPNRLP